MILHEHGDVSWLDENKPRQSKLTELCLPANSEAMRLEVHAAPLYERG
jgi:hypothetical protein